MKKQEMIRIRSYKTGLYWAVKNAGCLSRFSWVQGITPLPVDQVIRTEFDQGLLDGTIRCDRVKKQINN